jgi:6-phosphofructokinase
MKIGILTGGGDTASLNAIIYGAAKAVEEYDYGIVGFLEGWKGALDSVNVIKLDTKMINPETGGTLIKTSRTNLDEKTLEKVIRNIETRVDGLIAIGGDDTLTVGKKIAERSRIPVCCVTKTIDNDVGRNAPEGKVDYEKIVNYLTSGFATAAYKAASFASDLRTTAYSHERIMFLETMGRSPGWLALSSYKGKPDFILVPEVTLDFERFKKALAKRYNRAKNDSSCSRGYKIRRKRESNMPRSVFSRCIRT